MISIISASNREGNLTALFSKKCLNFLVSKKIDAQIFFLDELPEQLALKSIYSYEDSIFEPIGKKVIEPAAKLLFVAPEYNGSIPGILKLFIDAIQPKLFIGKKAALIGVAAGRAGNIRGMDHLTDILHHLQVNVMPQKLPISKMYDLLSEGELGDDTTLKALELQMQNLIDF